MSLTHLLGVMLLLMIIQALGTHRQVVKYKDAVHRLHKLGNLGIGSSRRKWGAGSIVIIACQSDGTITGGEMMRGMTIFSGFSPLEGIIGRSIYELKDEYTALPDKLKKLYKGHVQALEALEQRLAAGEVEEEEEKKEDCA